MKLLVRVLNIILTVAGSAAAVNVVLNGFTDAFSLIFAVAVTAIQVALFVYCNVRSTSLQQGKEKQYIAQSNLSYVCNVGCCRCHCCVTGNIQIFLQFQQ